jgi:hypothetical protein
MNNVSESDEMMFWLVVQSPNQENMPTILLAHIVAHFSAPLTQGRRIIFTCFTDSLMVLHANPDLVTVVA